MLIGLLAAPITFGAALVWMDGQLHPLLFGGVAIGLLLEHWAVGKRLSRLLYHGALLIKRGLRHWLLMTRRRCEDTSKVEMLPVSEENL